MITKALFLLVHVMSVDANPSNAGNVYCFYPAMKCSEEVREAVRSCTSGKATFRVEVTEETLAVAASVLEVDPDPGLRPWAECMARRWTEYFPSEPDRDAGMHDIPIEFDVECPR